MKQRNLSIGLAAGLLGVLLAVLTLFLISGRSHDRRPLTLDSPAARAATRAATRFENRAPAKDGPDLPVELRRTVAGRIPLAQLPWTGTPSDPTPTARMERLTRPLSLNTPPPDPLVSVRAMLKDDVHLLEWLSIWQSERAVHRAPTAGSLAQLQALIEQSPMPLESLEKVCRVIGEIEGGDSSVAATWSAAITARNGPPKPAKDSESK